MKDLLSLVPAMAILAACGRTAGVPDTGADGAGDVVTSDDTPLDTTGLKSDLRDAETADAPPSDPDAPDPGVAEDAEEPGEAPDDTEDAIGDVTGDVTADVPDDATGDADGAADIAADIAPDVAVDIAPDVAAEPGSDPFPSGFCAKKKVATWSRKVLHVGGVVTFNEVLYHPAGGPGLEWLELYNPLAVDTDLSGWRLDGAVAYTFPEGTILPGRGFLVVAADPAALAASNGIQGSLGPWAGQLPDEDGQVVLKNNAGRLMDSVAYDDSDPWPVAADGSGASLAKVDPDGSSEFAEGWTASRSIGGTPGQANLPDPLAPPAVQTLVAMDATWRYEASGADPGPSWNAPGFDDSAWPSAKATFVAGTGLPDGGGTVLPSGAITTYFRTDFDFAGDPATAKAWLDLLLDDGAVVYLNGVEVLRLDMPEGELSPSTPAAEPVGEPAFYGGGLLPAASLLPGPNVLAVEVHQADDGAGDLAFAARLRVSAWPAETAGGPGVVLNEVGGGSPPFWVEVANAGAIPADVGGIVIASSAGAEHVLPPLTLAPGAVLLVPEAALGFAAAVGDKVFLFAAGHADVLDAVEVAATPRARAVPGTGPWSYPDTATPGAANIIALHGEVVINEVMYHHAPKTLPDGTAEASPEEWIELFNRGSVDVDVGGWRLADEVEFEVPAGTTLPAGGYLILARDAAGLKAAHPGIPVVGDYDGKLDNDGGRILLLDACGNVADEVAYRDGGRWPSAADGGGSSLELRDPFADNAVPEAWAASDESAAASWQFYEYQDVAAPSPVGPDGQWQEFVMGLLDEGVVLLDDVSVVEDPAGAALERVQDGTFEAGAATGWRFIGNHRHSEVVPDPDDPGNHVLRLVATGATEHMHNHAEATLAGGHQVTNGQTYRVSFRARWVSGSNRLNTRLYFNRLARTTVLPVPEPNGTPGAQNTASQANLGPTYTGFGHAPAVPAAFEPVLVSVVASDPDGVAGVTLWTSVAGGAATATPMQDTGGGRYLAVVPGQAAGTLVQFWVEGSDLTGAVSAFPAAGPASRALWKVDDGLAATNGLHNVRILLTQADADWLHDEVNVMSNDLVGATVVYDEREAFYDVGVRLKGSERGRSMPPRTGFSVHFHPEQPFRGVYRTVMLDRSEGVGFGQREMLINQVMCHAGSVSCEYNDLVQVIPPRLGHTGPAELQLARFSDLFLDSQFEHGSDGMLFEYELIYYPTTTDDGTPEGGKLPQPDLVVGTPVKDLGDDQEAYRYNFIIKNNLWQDDYSGLIAFAKAFGLTGDAFNTLVDDYIDVDEWLRSFAFATLSGAWDQYASGAAHNAFFYVRPSDGRVLYLPHDLDFYPANPYNPVVWSGDLARLLEVPERLRRYYGHVLDIIQTSYNAAYMQRWCDHYGSLLPGQDFAGHCQFIAERSAWALDGAADSVSKAVPKVPFAITTNGGADFTVPGPAPITLDGTGWVDVNEIRPAGGAATLDVVWTGPTEWQASLPLHCGPNVIALEALDPHGSLVGGDSITVTASGGSCP